MKQLGLVTIDKMPDLKPDPKDPTKIDILCEVREMNRQMINFNIGYSGFDGFFIALGYQTQNFMGLGETLGVNFSMVPVRRTTVSVSPSRTCLICLPVWV